MSKAEGLENPLEGQDPTSRSRLPRESKRQHLTVTQRMRWAPRRETTRHEDMALQEAILSTTDGQSLFAWKAQGNIGGPKDLGLLASSPSYFEGSGIYVSRTVWNTGLSPSQTSKGIILFAKEGVLFTPVGYTTGNICSKSRPTIWLRKVDIVGGMEIFYRIRSWELGCLNKDDNLGGALRRVRITFPRPAPIDAREEYSDRKVFHMLDSSEEVFPAKYWDPQTKSFSYSIVRKR